MPRGWQPVRAVPTTRSQHLLGFGITPVGPRVVLPVVRWLAGERIAVDALAVRRADAPPSSAWTMLAPGPLARGPRDALPHTFALDDRHYVFADFRRPPYLFDVPSRQWSRIPLPSGDLSWTLEPGRDGLYAFSPAGADRPATAWFSADLGQTWEELPR